MRRERLVLFDHVHLRQREAREFKHLARGRRRAHAHDARRQACHDHAHHARDVTGLGVDYSIDATGAAPVIEQAIQVLAPRGVCGIVGAPVPGSTVALDL